MEGGRGFFKLVDGVAEHAQEGNELVLLLGIQARDLTVQSREIVVQPQEPPLDQQVRAQFFVGGDQKELGEELDGQRGEITSDLGNVKQRQELFPRLFLALLGGSGDGFEGGSEEIVMLADADQDLHRFRADGDGGIERDGRYEPEDQLSAVVGGE